MRNGPAIRDEMRLVGRIGGGWVYVGRYCNSHARPVEPTVSPILPSWPAHVCHRVPSDQMTDGAGRTVSGIIDGTLKCGQEAGEFSRINWLACRWVECGQASSGSQAAGPKRVTVGLG